MVKLLLCNVGNLLVNRTRLRADLSAAHQFDVSFHIQQEVFRLQVSVQDPFAMEVLESLCNAADAELGGGLIKAPPEGRTGGSDQQQNFDAAVNLLASLLNGGGVL